MFDCSYINKSQWKNAINRISAARRRLYLTVYATWITVCKQESILALRTNLMIRVRKKHTNKTWKCGMLHCYQNSKTHPLVRIYRYPQQPCKCSVKAYRKAAISARESYGTSHDNTTPTATPNLINLRPAKIGTKYNASRLKIEEPCFHHRPFRNPH